MKFDTTNNRMELTAVREAISHAPPGVRVDIVTDSKNVIGWLTGTFKRKDPTIAALSAEIDTLRDGRALQNTSSLAASSRVPAT